MQLTLKGIFTALLGWLIVQATILTVLMVLWNLVVSSFGMHEVNFLQMTGFYSLYKLCCFDWIKEYNKRMSSTPKRKIYIIFGWSIVLGANLLVLWTIWNLTMPSINLPKIDFLQTIGLYLSYKLFSLDWVYHWRPNNNK